MTDARKNPIRGLARVAFRALQPTIETELNEGWTAKAIYTRHSEKLQAISYTQFARYCRQLKQPVQPTAAAPGPSSEPQGPTTSVTKKFSDHTGVATFDSLRKFTG
jgi:hypothetical protein